MEDYHRSNLRSAQYNQRMSVTQSWLTLKDRIALTGTKGLSLNEAFINHSPALCHILFIKLLNSSDEWRIMQGNERLNNTTIINNIDYNDIKVFAPEIEVWNAYGIAYQEQMSQHDIANMAVLELLGEAETKGCLLTELTKGAKLHHSSIVLDCLVALGLVTKSMMFNKQVRALYINFLYYIYTHFICLIYIYTHTYAFILTILAYTYYILTMYIYVG